MAITSIKTGSSFKNLIKYNDFLGPNSAYIPTSFESIASATGTGSSGTITFSSIPSTYKHLQIRINTRTDVTGTAVLFYFTLNGDTGTNYANHYLLGNGTAVSASGGSATSTPYIGYTTGTLNLASTTGSSIIDIHDYASTTKNKTIRAFSGSDDNTVGRLWLGSGLWVNTSAVTSISLSLVSGNFTTASTFALYGIKGA